MNAEDQKLLELAAKAAGYEPVRLNDDGESLLLYGVQEPWNPLKDDGDAFRLMVRLGIDLRMSTAVRWACANEVEEAVCGDEMLATRRAIVRAAAAMGVEV